MIMSIKFENEIVGFLRCPTAHDAFRSMTLLEKLCFIRHEIALDQIEDMTQILYGGVDELEKFKALKIRGINCHLDVISTVRRERRTTSHATAYESPAFRPITINLLCLYKADPLEAPHLLLYRLMLRCFP